jgi:predicted DNA-binding transcriptional regulator
MSRQSRPLGITIFIVCIIGFIIYAWFLLVSEWKEIILQLTVLAAVAGLLGVLAWIGLTMAATVRPTENIDKTQPDS